MQGHTAGCRACIGALRWARRDLPGIGRAILSSGVRASRRSSAFPTGTIPKRRRIRDMPHYQYPPWASYDGQFYAQRALDPLVARSADVDRAMDLAPFRARRILFSWTAYVLGLGRPAWILEAYRAPERRRLVDPGVAADALAALALRPRTCALGRLPLFTRPSLVGPVRASGRPEPAPHGAVPFSAAEASARLLSAFVAGVNGLGRETNVLGVLRAAISLVATRLASTACAAVSLVLPLLLWEDYLHSIYRSTIFAGGDQLRRPVPRSCRPSVVPCRRQCRRECSRRAACSWACCSRSSYRPSI